MYKIVVPTITLQLKNLSGVLKTAAKDAKSRNIDPDVLLNARLAPDMLPLIKQVQIASDHAKGSCARLAGVEPPVYADDEASFADLEKRIRSILAFIRTLKPAQFEGCETREVKVVTRFGTLSFNGLDYYNGWAIPNFFFHSTSAYAILRHNGVPLGKADFVGDVPGMTATGLLAKMLSKKPKAKARKKK